MASSQAGKDNFTKYLVVGVVVLVIGIMAVPTFLAKNKSVSQAIPAAATSENDYAFVFNADIPNLPVVDIYEDFQCPICQQFEGLNGAYVTSLVADKKATVKYHILSFIGPESIRAANASACANDEGKFVAFHNALYANQPTTENSGAWSADRIISIAESVGIKSDVFTSCVKDLKYEGWVSKVAAAGAKAGVNATPTVFVGGKEIDRKSEYFDAAKFKAAVERG